MASIQLNRYTRVEIPTQSLPAFQQALNRALKAAEAAGSQAIEMDELLADLPPDSGVVVSSYVVPAVEENIE